MTLSLNFIKAYIKNPRTVGAVAPSSKRLAKGMISGINFNTASCIVEYGPGTGVFTEEILKRKNKETVFIAIEYNPDFYEILKAKFGQQPQFILINGSAENLKDYLADYHIEKVDYIVSGLPFASLPDQMSQSILGVTQEVLSQGGKFITFQYTLLKMSLFRDYLSKISHQKILLNLPPAYVLTCEV